MTGNRMGCGMFLKRAWLSGVFLMSLAGCSRIDYVPSAHIVMLDADGGPVDPRGNWLEGRQESFRADVDHGASTGLFGALGNFKRIDVDRTPGHKDSDYDIYLDRMFSKIADDFGAGQKRKVMIFVHGGLNTQNAAIRRAAENYEMIQGHTGYYPIFINWRSSLISSYFEHLFFVRQGENVHWLGFPLFPFYLATDVARGVAQAPRVWTTSFLRNPVVGSIGRWISTLLHGAIPWSGFKSVYERKDYTDRVREDLEHRYERDGVDHGSQIGFSTGEDKRWWVNRWLISPAKFVATAPLKFVSAPLIDMFGTGAWENMLRRTTALYHQDEEFETGKFPNSHDGGLPRFMERLGHEIANHGAGEEWEIVLVGHSMGAIVINQMLREFPAVPGTSNPKEPMPYDTIVYMAAASSIADWRDSVLPYLERNDKTEFYNLTLHPIAETNETYLRDLVMRGSLLEWIDMFLATPKSPIEYRMGRLDALTRAAHEIPEDLRPRVHIKSFDAGNPDHPSSHGSFDDPGVYREGPDTYSFWDRYFWEPRP